MKIGGVNGGYRSVWVWEGSGYLEKGGSEEMEELYKEEKQADGTAAAAFLPSSSLFYSILIKAETWEPALVSLIMAVPATANCFTESVALYPQWSTFF